MDTGKQTDACLTMRRRSPNRGAIQMTLLQLQLQLQLQCTDRTRRIKNAGPSLQISVLHFPVLDFQRPCSLEDISAVSRGSVFIDSCISSL